MSLPDDMDDLDNFDEDGKEVPGLDDDPDDDICPECNGTGLSWDGLGECPYCLDGYVL